MAGALTVSGTATPARAADAADDKTTQAKALWQEANSHYAVGEFEQAAEKYQAAYKLKPDAALLYNAAQSYRLAGKNDKALLLYKNYVMFYPNAKNAANVQQQIVKLQEAIAAQEKAKNQPPTTTDNGGSGSGTAPGPVQGQGGAAVAAAAGEAPRLTQPPAAPVPDTSSGQPAPAAVTLSASATAPAEPPTPIYKRWWLWTIVGVVVVGGVTAAVLATRSSEAWNTAPDFGPGATGKLVGP